MTRITWKAEASGITKQEATAAPVVARGELGSSAVTITRDKDTGRLICFLEGKACLEITEKDGDVSKVKILDAGKFELAEIFTDLID